MIKNIDFDVTYVIFCDINTECKQHHVSPKE